MNCRKTFCSSALVSFAALSLTAVAGCSLSADDEATGRGDSAIEGDVCSATDPTCPAPCDPADPTCASACTAGDPSCPPAPSLCAPMSVETAGDCDRFWGYAWDGAACVGLSGCECKGDCDALFSSAEQCRTSYAACAPIPPDCAALAAQVATLLRAAQLCNVASMSAFTCRTFVPSLDGCSQPVAALESDATKAYLDAFEHYARYCPLPDPACPDPTQLQTACVQSPDVDSLIGGCAFVDDGSVPDDGDE